MIRARSREMILSGGNTLRLMKSYFAYIRVSTVKQGEKGSSLQEQRAAIEAYAQRHNLNVSEWFEEQKTAAKQGRPVFVGMLRALDKGSVAGVITHKIDRSARNLRDWATLGDLLDRGVELHFAHESIDLSSRGGRLSADIQAVVAADFIRNLREETRKGFYGRLKQGLYPMRAPLGYLDCGRGMPKTIDPERGFLILEAFKLYATGNWSFEKLGTELYARGLRNRSGKRVTNNGLSTILNNPFYTGLVRIKKTGESFLGIHQPLMSKKLFDDVHTALRAATTHRVVSHRYRYQGSMRCAACGYSLIAEKQKGHVYYRCHTRSCSRVCIREDHVTGFLRASAPNFRFSEAEWSAAQSDLERFFENYSKDTAGRLRALSLSIAAVDERVHRVTDAYVDQLIDKQTYVERKERLLGERLGLTSRKASLEAGNDDFQRYVETSLELIKALGNMPDRTPDEDLRELLKKTTSNLSVSGKTLQIAWAKPFSTLCSAGFITAGDPKRCKPRTSTRISMLKKLLRRMLKSKRLPSPITKKPSEPTSKPNAGWQALQKNNLERRRNKEGGTGDTGALAA